MRSLLLLALLALAITLVASICDTFQSGSPKDLKTNCFNTFKFNKKDAKTVIGALQKNFELNTFTKIYASKVAPFNIKVNIAKSLKAIGKKKYKYQFDFYSDLSFLLAKLRDPHVKFQIPSGYKSFQILRPYSVAFTLGKKGKLKATLESCYNCTSKKGKSLCNSQVRAQVTAVCVSLNRLIGKQVQKINGKSPFDYYLKNYAQNSGTHPDLGGRFNYLIESQNSIDLVQFYKNKKAASQEILTFAGGVQVTVPIIANNLRAGTAFTVQNSTRTLVAAYAKFKKYVTAKFKNKKSEDKNDFEVEDNYQVEFEKDNQLSTFSEELEIPYNEDDEDRDEKIDEESDEVSRSETERKGKKKKKKKTNKCKKLIVIPYDSKKSNSTIALCKSVKTGLIDVIVATIPSFGGGGNDTLFMLGLINGLAISNNITKMIIDVSNNGGGIISFGYAALQTLTGEIPSNLVDYYVAKKTKALTFFMTKGKVSQDTSLVFNDAGTSVGTNKQYFNLGKSKLAIDKKATWTLPQTLLNSKGFTTFQQFLNADYAGQSIQFIPANPARQILFLTNGICASTCSIFLSKITQLASNNTRYRVVQYGGVPKAAFDTSMVACNLARSPGGVTKIPFRAMKTQADINGKGGTLRQFTRDSPTVRLFVWRNHTNLKEIYSKTIDLFV